MARPIPLLVSLVVLCLLTSCASPSYRYYGIVFDGAPRTVFAEGIRKPEQCKALFEPPGAYIGPVIDIPKDAAVFGTLIVTRQDQLKALPLYTWQDEAGNKKFGCNGPAPQFAHQAKAQDELMTSITKVLGQDESKE